MKKNLLLLSAAFACAAGAASAQGVAGDAGTLTALLPAGVTANATFNERDYAEKNICVAGSEEKGYLAYFCADDGVHGEELWATDGTPDGTYMVKDINTEKDPAGLEGSTRGAAIAHFLNFYNKKLFFKAWSWASGNEPWAYDLETGEAYEIFNTNDTFNPDNTDEAGVPMGNGGGVTKTGYPAFGHVFFRSSTPSTGSELGMTNCEKGN